MSTRLVMLGAEAADTVRAAAKRRTKSWNKEAILTGVASIVEEKHMEKGEERKKERKRDSTTRRDVNCLERTTTTIIMDFQSYCRHERMEETETRTMCRTV